MSNYKINLRISSLRVLAHTYITTYVRIKDVFKMVPKCRKSLIDTHKSNS